MDNIPFKLVAVNSFSDLQRQFARNVLDEEFASTQVSVVLINCGATVNLKSYLNLPDSCTALVIDCHRPFDLTNTHFSNTNVSPMDSGILIPAADSCR
jgi:hypothetical protein